MNIWCYPITKQTIIQFGIAHYHNPRALWSVFFSDMKALTHVARAIDKLADKMPDSCSDTTIKNIINEIVQLHNSFPADSLSRMLFALVSEKTYTCLKTILVFLSYAPHLIPEVPIKRIEIDTNFLKLLQRL